jgi:hypothetical protein
MLGLRVHTTYVLIDVRTELADCQIMVPAVTDPLTMKPPKKLQTFQLPSKMASLVLMALQFSSQPMSFAIQSLLRNK